MKHEAWAEAALDLGLPHLPEGAAQRLDRFETLLVERAAPMGMIAPRDVPIVRERHILDSLRAAPHLADAGSVCDMGSGAGLPGIPLAVVLPGTAFTLVEVRRNRATFLDLAVRELHLENVEIYPRRVETLRRRFDACCSRAFAGASPAWTTAQRILKPGGALIYWAGVSFGPGADTPHGVDVSLFHTNALARAGPLAIMSAQ